MGIKLSIIVPIYKVEKYLRKCVDSILHQDILQDEYEIILVDDGSPDGCGVIADEYASKYTNIRAIHQTNGGLSAARNTGLGVANGEYIQFVDSDDYLEPGVLGALVSKMDSDSLDVLRFDYQNVNEKYEVFQPYKEVMPFVDLRDEICDGLTFLDERLGYACYACQFIIRASLLKKSGLLFKEGILFEDTEWAPRVLIRAARVTSTRLVVYNYLLRSGSITHAKTVEQHQKVLDAKISLIQDLRSQSEFIPRAMWYKGMIAFTALSALSLIAGPLYNARNLYLRKLKELDIFPLTLYHASSRNSRKLKLINLSPRLFSLVYHLKNKS